MNVEPRPTDSAVDFPCSKCGAPELAWDASHRKLVCPYCGHRMDVPAGVEAGRTAHYERPLHEGLARIAQGGGGLGVQRRVSRCQNCGATVSFAEAQIASRCDFCGSDQVLEAASSDRQITPQALVPFFVEQAEAQAKFRGWLHGLWFRPNALKKQAEVGAIAGVYVPYWTFDANVASRWTAQAGYYYYVTVRYTAYENGKSVQRTRQERRTRWEPASGSRRDRYDDVLVVASRGLPEKLADRMTTFDTRALVPYDPRYLAGWRAEEYAVELDAASQSGRQRIVAEQKRRCARDVPGDTHRSLQVQNTIADETFKHVLLPLWIASYRFKDKPYRFLVNGQTGEVTGEAPWSWIKITLLVLVLAAAAFGLFYASQAR
ncbi:MAG: zinc ribbon domain-containing protein [Myxococcota bacterium]